MSLICDLLGRIVAAGATTVATAGTGLPLFGVTYNTGTVTLTDKSVDVSSAGGADLTAAHNLLATGNVLYLKTAGGHIYKVKSINATANTLVLFSPALATESGVAYTLYTLYSGRVIVVSAPGANTGGIWLGNSAVDKDAKNGIYIAKGSNFMIHATGEIDWYVDADTSNDVVSWVVLD